jgi:predicted ATP-binding protein involved in virulence
MNLHDVRPTRRLKTVYVDGLFGVFDHRIELNEEHITIIHGPNGFGKTAILRIISGFFERRYSMIRNVPFYSIRFVLNDNSEIRVEQIATADGHNPSKPSLRILYGTESWVCQPVAENQPELPRRDLEQLLPWLHRLEEDSWFDYQTGERLDTADVIDRYSEQLPLLNITDHTPASLREIQDSVQVYFIRANRLEAPPDLDIAARRARFRSFRPAPAVSSYASELAQRIHRVQSEYAKLAQSLDRSFPLRIMSQLTGKSLSLEEVRHKLSALDEQRRDLQSVGLLEQSAQDNQPIPEPDASQLAVLAVYIDDVTQKLDVFSDLRRRIELFLQLLNCRFTYKKVRVDKRLGLVFQAAGGQDLPPTSLSTGEQHELVILYQLLFLTEADSLVLIDEPEISLHVAWQTSFLKDLARISSVTNVDFLIATHSPQIIGNRWDLTVELKSPSK